MDSDKTKSHRTLLKYLPAGAVVLDIHGNIVYMNPSAEKIMEISSEEVLQKPFKEILDPESAKMFGISSERVKEKKGVYVFYMKREGDRFIKISVSPIIQEDEVSGFLLILDDVTEEVLTSTATNKLIKEMMDAIALTLQTLKSMVERAHRLKEKGVVEELLPSLKQMEVNLRRIKEISPELPQRVETDLAGFIRTVFEGLESRMVERKVSVRFNFVAFPRIFVTKSLFSVKLTDFMDKVIPSLKEGDVIWVKVDKFNENGGQGSCVITMPLLLKDEDISSLKEFIEKEDGKFAKLDFADKFSAIGFSFPVE